MWTYVDAAVKVVSIEVAAVITGNREASSNLQETSELLSFAWAVGLCVFQWEQMPKLEMNHAQFAWLALIEAMPKLGQTQLSILHKLLI